MQDVKAAADMVELVSARTPLRRESGSRFTGRCPFHEEKTPSFSVNPVDKLYYCFGCGKGGDLVAFVRETENLDFVGAILSIIGLVTLVYAIIEGPQKGWSSPEVVGGFVISAIVLTAPFHRGPSRRCPVSGVSQTCARRPAPNLKTKRTA